MNIHEYQAKTLFAQYGISVPTGKSIENTEEAKAWAGEFSSPLYVVKAQIHAGGRGKAGGVKLAKNPNEMLAYAKELLGKTLVTHQTGPNGRKVHRLLIEEGVQIEKELYLSLLVDRSMACPVVVASSAGGMEIEELAEHSPEKIIKVHIDPVLDFKAFYGRSLAFKLGLAKTLVGPFTDLLAKLYRLFTEKGASLIEVNPLVVTKDHRLIALDAKMALDDNEIFRHEDIRTMRDLNEEEPLEIEASRYNLNYVKLDGKIGCMVNGAGLAMATMDIIKLAGEEPANFLDVGGTATKETVKEGFQILLSDPNVKGIFVNIFGGIVRCERIAGGILDAAEEVRIGVPLVVRLEGTNADEGRKMLKQSSLKLDVATDLWEGAQKIVELVRGTK
jgi:succinyl-CoA synthetase beta subunit